MSTTTEREHTVSTFNKVMKTTFIWTEGITYVLIVPITAAFLLYQIDMGMEKNLIFLGALLIGIVASFMVSLYQFKYNSRVFTASFLKWANGEPVSEEEFLTAQKAFFNFPIRHTGMVIIRWFVVMPVMIIFVNLLADITVIQQFNMWAVLLFDVALTVIFFYRVTERGTEKIAELGVLNRDTGSVEEKPRHLSVSLTFVVISYFVLTLIFIIIVIFNLNYRQTRSLFADQMRTLSGMAGKSITDLVEEKAAEVKLLASQEDLPRNMAPGRHNALLRDLAPGKGIFEYAFMTKIGAAPAVLSSSAPALAGARITIPEIIDGIERANTGAATLSGAHKSPLSGKPAAVICVPIKAGNRVTGTVCLSLDLASAARRLIGDIKIGDTGFLAALDRNNLIMLHPDSARLLENIDTSGWAGGLAGLPGGSLHEYDREGRKQFAYKTRSKDMGFSIIAEVEHADIDGNLWNTGIATIIISIFCLAIVSFLMHVLISKKLMPLKTYSQVIENIARGDLKQRLNVLSNDEVGNMSLRLISFMRRLRKSMRNIKDISDELASSSTEMSATVATFADNAQSQAASAEEVTATIEEMASGMEGVANGATMQYDSMESLKGQLADLSGKINEMSGKVQSAFSIADNVAGKARDGEQMMKDMNTSMEKIIGSSNEMTSILGIITGISEQINLLALNASIEAARAGDAGRGFAVVADEVSKLADQTAVSIKDIDRHIKTNSEETARGISNSQKTVETISLIIEGVATMRAMMGSMTDFMRSQTDINKNVNSKAEEMENLSHTIRIAAEEQKRAVSEIVKSVTNINDTTQANASGSEELSGTSENLSAMAETLKQAVDFFKI